MKLCWILLSCAVTQVISLTPSGRTVYNLHTRPAHWAAARATCAGYDAKLVTVDSAEGLQADLETLDLLDWDGAFNNMISTGSVWTGLYRSRSPDGDNSLAWDTCTSFAGASSPNANIDTELVSGTEYCTSMGNGYTLQPRACDQQLPFICQLEFGQCWFLPLDGRSFSRNADLTVGGDKHECAQACRNQVSAEGECWGFVAKNGQCSMFVGTEGHVFVRDPTSHLVTDPDSTAHVKICTGGWLTSAEAFSSVVTLRPAYQNCSDTAGTDWNTGICYCDCQSPPTVLSPDYLLSSPEEKADQISSELLVNPTETSKAQRRLTSADDPRPSAKSVGSFGIVILTLVFGGLVVLDLDVLFRHLRKRGDLEHQQQQEQPQQ